MCDLSSKDYTYRPDTYGQQTQGHYSHVDTPSLPPSPQQRSSEPQPYQCRPHQQHRQHHQYYRQAFTPPQGHAEESDTLLLERGHQSQPDHQRASSEESCSASGTQKSALLESPLALPARLPDPRLITSQPKSLLAGRRRRCRPHPGETEQLSAALKNIVELKEFLVSAPAQFGPGEFIRQFRLPSEEQVSCIRWKQVFCITGTDIVRALVFRFSVFGREVINRKKFEEGVFSDLRNLKINVDATLEGPKSELLELLYKHHCVRTKKKQKVFFWYSVQHDQLFIDTLERELKREEAHRAVNGSKPHELGGFGEPYSSAGSPASTRAVREPALSFTFDSAIPLIEQISTISRELPAQFAEVIKATGLNVEHEDASLSFDYPANAMPIPRRGPDSRLDRQTSSPRGYEFPYNTHPMTPAQSVETSDTHALISPGFYGRQSTMYTTSSSFGGLPTPTSSDTNRPAKATRNLSPRYCDNPRNGLSLNPITSAGDLEQPVSRHTFIKPDPEDSDFPLELLVQHDYEHQKPIADSSFHNKYHDYVYNNRPALVSSSALAPSPLSASAGSCLPLLAPEWVRDTATESPSSPNDGRVIISPNAQHFPPLWSGFGQHRGLSVDGHLNYRNLKGERRESGRISKHPNSQLGQPSVMGGAYTDGY